VQAQKGQPLTGDKATELLLTSGEPAGQRLSLQLMLSAACPAAALATILVTMRLV
jgi:hypothetical protein